MKTPQLLNYHDTGTGPVVVLLHGYLASSAYWQKVADKLSRNHRVIAIDLLGFGKSPKPLNSKYDYEAHVQSINNTLEALQVPTKFTLIGHSMGSLVALRYTTQHEQRVKKLILANMPVLLSRDEAKREIMGTNFVYRLGLQPVLHDVIWPLFVLTTTLRLLPKRVAEGAVLRRKYMFQSTGFSRLRSMRNVILAATIEADLTMIDVATTLISGLSDRQQYLVNLPRLREAKNIVSRTVAGGHHLPLTNPELFAELI